jgi:DNA mismatch endonuclease (patch repair protein)
VKDVPGRPDFVFAKRRKVIFVHGCFWHLHRCRFGRVVPRTNARFWAEKRAGNVARDRKVRRRLNRLGWRVLTVWECQTRRPERLAARLAAFLALGTP